MAEQPSSKQCSDTPLTDAAVMDGWSGDAACVSYEECQAIERMLNDARRELARYESGRVVLTGEIDRLRMAERLNVETVANFQKRIDDLELELHHWKDCHGVTADALAEARATQPPEVTRDRLFGQVMTAMRTGLGAGSPKLEADLREALGLAPTKAEPPAGSQWPSLDARWIPVIERIPEPEVLVLAWDGGRTFVTWFGSLRDAGCGVTHWIPYPMPPGAKSDMHDGRRAVVTKEGDGYGHCPECRAVPGTCIHSADEKPAPVHLRDIDSGGCVSHCPACRASAETSPPRVCEHCRQRDGSHLPHCVTQSEGESR